MALSCPNVSNGKETLLLQVCNFNVLGAMRGWLLHVERIYEAFRRVHISLDPPPYRRGMTLFDSSQVVDRQLIVLLYPHRPGRYHR